MSVVTWSDEVDDVLGGDLTAALAYLTPAHGAVVTAVAPIGLRDRDAGTVMFTTSLGLGRKLERIRRNPRISLAYHAREHGFASSPRFVLVQGTAAVTTDPDRDFLETVIGPQAERFMGPPKRGRLFWDRWLQEYYADRVPVTVTVERIVSWPDLRCGGSPDVYGAPRPEQPAEAQAPPRNGTGPRVDSDRAAQRSREMAHTLLAFADADGFPLVVPVAVTGVDRSGVRIGGPPFLLPRAGRRAGLLAHSYRPKLVGLAARQYTGWLEVHGRNGDAVYAPHTEKGFRAPANKTLLLLANGLLAKRGLRRARRSGRTAAASS
jgi:general stress protein 26